MRYKDLMREWEIIRGMVNDELNHIRGQLNIPEDLRNAAFHLILAGGKRIRPLILMLTARMYGVEYNKSLPAATSIELLHNFTLVHDDITDKDEFRRGIPTTHVKYGEDIALVAGDFLFSYLYYYLINRYLVLSVNSSLIVKIISAISEVMNSICIGQIMDLLPEKYIKDMNDYMDMVYHKTAALIEASSYIGGLLGNAPPTHLEMLRRYGKNIGVAFQIADDLLGIFGDPKITGKPVGNDLRMGKKTLLVLYALDRMSDEDKQLFHKVFGNRDADDDVVKEVIRIFASIEVVEYAKSIMEDLRLKAITALRGLPYNKYKDYLEELSNYIITRTF